MKKLLIASALSALAASAFAAPVTYAIDPTHTYATYEVSHMGFSTQRGTFAKTDGKVVLDAKTRKGEVDITIDSSSLQTLNAKRDEHLKGPDFFNAEKFPSITFKSTSLQFSGDKLTAVKGNLTLLGVTKPVTLKVTRFHHGKHPMIGKDTYGADAETVIKRSEFGMNTYVPAISDDVKLVVSIEAIDAQ
ncbi:YceI family protein [Microvirgula aerodenitrificans]|uniref:YceI family protein n=1 Tax=Microvirgula aerodenitrificans TaxID=57480 RepID=UPI00048B8002|nr:YceI family protein [Microvirgula aerodenitrificans]